MSAAQILLPLEVEINQKETRRAAEEELGAIRVYRQIGFVRREMKTTASSQPRFHGPTNVVGKPAEEIAVWNVDMENEFALRERNLDSALRRLKRLEREILTMRYLGEEDELDCNVCEQLTISERKYRKVKTRALILLALMLRIEVYAGE